MDKSKNLPIFIPVDIDSPLGHFDMIVIFDSSGPEIEDEEKDND